MFSDINPKDVLFEDDNVQILKPNVPKGILVFHNYQETTDRDIPSEGLKSGVQLQEEGYDFGRSRIHPYIFFRAPHKHQEIDYSTLKTQIDSSFKSWVYTHERTLFLRVNPTRTCVFSSEIRASSEPEKFIGSKKGMLKYFDIIKRNEEIYSTFDFSYKYPVWNLYDSKISWFPTEKKELIKFPWCEYPINTCSEVLVNLPHIPPEWLIEIKN
jgi:hypothetical protein